MRFTQHHEITKSMKKPFTLIVVPRSIEEKCRRTKFASGQQALQKLRAMKLDASRFYGAEIVDSNGLVIAELE
ncbi:MAG: hypothetical protein U0872_15350 [Planctomycetaceae bacterium]